MASRRNSRYHIVVFVCSRYIISICTSIKATKLYTQVDGDGTNITGQWRIKNMY